MSPFKLLKKAGFSLVEMAVVLGLTGAVGLSAAYLFSNMDKTKANLDRQLEFNGVEKLLRGALISPAGCRAVMDKTLGSPIIITDASGNDILSNHKSLKDIQIESFNFSKFESSGDPDQSGLATFVIEMKSKKSKTTVQKDITISLKMNADKVVGCDINKNQIREYVRSKLCADLLGQKTKGMDCDQAMTVVVKDIKQSICEDLTGTSAVSSDPYCDLKMGYAGVSCPSGKYLNGFNVDGSIICGEAAPASVKPCLAWSEWSPAASSVCTTSTIYQVKNCIDGGTPTNQSQTVAGTKTTDECAVVKACASYSPEWTPASSAICSGVSINQEKSCLDGGFPEKVFNPTSGTKTTGECAPTTSGGGGGGGGSCFVAGTKVTLWNGLSKNIEDLKIGELVKTYDEVTSKVISRPIKEIFHHEEKISSMYHFKFSNGHEIKSNDIHLYFVPELNNYLSASELYRSFVANRPVSLVGTDGKLVSITLVKITMEKVKLFNIHVHGLYDGKTESPYNHNYYANGVLVHNLKMIEDEISRDFQ